MAHKQHFEFFDSVKLMFPRHFSSSKVLDIGSLDINGCNKPMFRNCEYIGVDIGPGKNVDVVCLAHEYDGKDESFDTIVSSNCFEHDMYFHRSLSNALRMLKKSGLLLFVCKTIPDGGNERTGEHGTIGSDTFSSPLTSSIHGWNTYYKNLTRSDVEKALSPKLNFSPYEISINAEANDIRFWGIKCASS
jgi:SAM-dependent methyltransferase